MRNTLKNTGGVTGKGFDVKGQPSPDSKKAGWERRKQGQKFMSKMMEYQDMTLADFEVLLQKINNNKDKYTLGDLIAYKYVTNTLKVDKFLINWLDRVVGKAPKDRTSQEPKEEVRGIIVKIINSREELESSKL